VKKTPLTNYPSKLAGYVFELADLKPSMKFLDIGAGRFEMARGFKQLGLDVTGLDSSVEAETYARNANVEFFKHEFAAPEPLPFASESFDVVFSKSFIEHMKDPTFFLSECNRILKPKGKVIILTPDWEANTKIFYDDVTHVKPFTRESLEQILLLCNFKNNKVFRFRQLPLSWKYKSYKFISVIIAPFVPVRTKITFLRWSRELMLYGSGIKGE
jgi:SAM-dependent methyltransferase